MQHETSVDIDAAGTVVWDVLTDVERWPAWTASMQKADQLDDRPLSVGSRVRIKQPKFPAVVWVVTELEPTESFSWAARSAGVTSVASHKIAPRTGGGVTVTLHIHQSGPIGAVLGLVTSGLTRRYMKLEAEGLKRRCEAS